MSKSNAAPDPTEAAVSKGRRDKTTRNLPTKNLPTNRISVPKQIEILRAYAASSEPDGRAVTNAEVGDIVGLTANTVSLANAFFTSAGLLERTENGYIPVEERGSAVKRNSCGRTRAGIIAERTASHMTCYFR